MKICTTPQERRDALEIVKPIKIAVAYVGMGWDKYIDKDFLEEIILSPTLGSNPLAILEIVKVIGFDNVYFLDRLHSKIYIGNDQVFLGSPNLSTNGFSNNGNHEIGVLLEKGASQKKCSIDIFDAYKAEAQKDYHDEESKWDKLKKLYRRWQESIESEFNISDNKSSNKEKPDLNLITIHVVPYIINGDLEYNFNVVLGAINQLNSTKLDDYFKEDFEFLPDPDDNIQKGDWILAWPCDQKGYPIADERIYWVYVHHVIPSGYIHSGSPYTKLVGQAASLKTPPEPFRLTPTKKANIRVALNSGNFNDMLFLRKPWTLGPADKLVPAFLAAI
jgi:hypothetical protein